MKIFDKLEINSQGSLHLRTEQIDLTGQRILAYHILYISDLHLGWARSARIVENLIDIAQAQRPDLILLGGDLVDRPRGLALLSQAVQQLSAIALTAAIAGNHDVWIGVERVRQAVLAGGGDWLEGRSLRFSVANKTVRVDGGMPLIGFPSTDGLADEHVAHDSDDYAILCAHNPIAVEQAQAYQLVLAGHLHGCQCVLWRRQHRLYPGAWLYRWNGLRFQQGQTKLLVSRGVGDTFPMRWNCPREVILCQIF
jgi:uncharacterized protein